jgi:hypothetical protein
LASGLGYKIEAVFSPPEERKRVEQILNIAGYIQVMDNVGAWNNIVLVDRKQKWLT